MTEPKSIPANEWRYLPEDLLTHIDDFRNAVLIAMDCCNPHGMVSLDPGDMSYWEKQLQTIDRIKSAMEDDTAHLSLMTPVEAETLVANAENKHNEQIEHISKFAVGMAMMNMGMRQIEVSTADLALLINQFDISMEKRTGNGDVLMYTLTHKDEAIEQQRVANGYASDAGQFDNSVVDRLAQLLKQRLAEKRMEGKGGWQDKDGCSADVLRTALQRHLDETGDHLNVIAYAMMLHYRGDPLGLASLDA